MDAADVDHNFEPQIRARSNTWPLRPSRELEPQSSPASEDSNNDGQKEKDPLGLTAKKSGSRRNAWGNLSYADLITKAIQSSPEKRLTLSQIYDWMVQNVPYFKDKGDSTSSAGWKNSIRHNLSLHSRFMRIQNEGTGKSSWWVINPDAKPGKAPRRRAGSMETKNYEKKRGRVKKKVEALRAAMENGGSPLTGSEDYLDTLGFGDFRPRTSSNASSCGRLSPIHAGIEPDLHDNQVPPMSPIPWGAEVEDSQGMYPVSDNYSDLVDSLVDGMKLSNQDSMDMVNGMATEPYLSTNGPTHDFNQSPASFMNMNDHMGDTSQFSHLPAPPPYPDRGTASPQLQQSTGLTTLEQAAFPNNSYPNLHRSLNGYGQQEMYRDTTMDQLSVNTQPPQLSSPDRSQQASPSPQTFQARLSPQIQRASPQPVMSPLNCQLSPQQTRALIGSPAQRASPSLQAQQQAALQQAAANVSILREALTRGAQVGVCQPTTIGMPLAPGTVTTATTSNMNSALLNLGLSPHHRIPQPQPQQHSPQVQQQQQQQLCNQVRVSPSNTFMGIGDTGNIGCEVVNSSSMPTSNNSSNNNLPLDIDMESLISVDYDMDQVIKHELSLEGNLDFNFDGMSAPPSTASQNIVH